MFEGSCGRSLLNQENTATRLSFLSQMYHVSLEGLEQKKIVQFRLHIVTLGLELEIS